METVEFVETAEITLESRTQSRTGVEINAPGVDPGWNGVGGSCSRGRGRTVRRALALHWFEESARIIKKPPETNRTGGVARKTFFNLVAPPTREHQETPGNNPDWGSGPKNLF